MAKALRAVRPRAATRAAGGARYHRPSARALARAARARRPARCAPLAPMRVRAPPRAARVRARARREMLGRKRSPNGAGRSRAEASEA